MSWCSRGASGLTIIIKLNLKKETLIEGSGLALSGKPSAHLDLIDNIIVMIGKW